MRTNYSIQWVLTKNKDELFSYMQDPSQFTDLKNYVNKLLDSNELKDNISVLKCKNILNKHANQYNLYVSSLMAYLTGIKVS